MLLCNQSLFPLEHILMYYTFCRILALRDLDIAEQELRGNYRLYTEKKLGHLVRLSDYMSQDYSQSTQ